jgi:hypothetical protein
MKNWHTETIKRFKTLDNDSLLYIRLDSYHAAEAGDTINNPKAGRYLDEFLYASQELRRRGITPVSF